MPARAQPLRRDDQPGYVLHGYAYDPQYGHAASAFYPGYPLAVAAVYWPMHLVGSLFLNGRALATFSEDVLLPLATLLVCNLALLAALAFLWRLYSERLGSRTALIGIGLLLTAPTSFFFSNGFSESLFLLAVVAAFLLAEHDRWISAAAVAGTACLIRFPGAFLLLPLALLWFRSPKPRPGRQGAIGAGIFAIGAIVLWG